MSIVTDEHGNTTVHTTGDAYAMAGAFDECAEECVGECESPEECHLIDHHDHHGHVSWDEYKLADLPDMLWGQQQSLATVDTQLLLVSLLPQPLDSDLMNALDAGTKVMEAQGVSFIGSILPQEGQDDSIELIANLQNSIGSTPVDAVDFYKQVQDWLLMMPFDGVLVLYNPPTESDQDLHHAFLITDQFELDLELDQDTVPVMLSELHEHGYEG